MPATPAVLAAAGLSAATLQDLAPVSRGSMLTFEVVLDGVVEEVVADPYDLRAPGFVAYVRDAAGMRPVPAAAAVTWRGALVGRPASDVRVAWVDGRVTASIWPDRGAPGWVVEPLRAFDASAPRARHLVYRSSAVVHAGACAALDPVVGTAGRAAATGTAGTALAEIAIECDATFTAQFGNTVAAVQTDVQSLMAAVDAIFARDVGVRYSLTSLIVDVGTDPYPTTSPIPAGGSGSLLAFFQQHWRANQGAIQRDVAHLLSSRDFTGGQIGAANNGTICSTQTGYSVTQHFRSVGSFAGRVGLTAHELAHNWSATHCDLSSPADCRIMCSSLSGCLGDQTRFGQASINAMLAFRASRPCLEEPPPELVAPPFVNTGPTPATPWHLEFCGRPGDFYVLFVALNQTATVTVPGLGIEFLLGSFEVTNGLLDGSGQGSFGVPVPVTAVGVLAATQILTVDPGFTSLRSSNVGTSFVLF